MFNLKPYIAAYKVKITNLPIATTKHYSFNTVDEDGLFKSQVQEIILCEKDMAIVIVKIWGSYPFITDQWEQFIEPTD